jgi:ketosteroid isomerase-like protein
MRFFALLLALSSISLSAADSSDEKNATAAVQRFFDAMSAHDSAALRELLMPDARLFVVLESGASSSVTGDEFITRIAAAKGPLLERMWNPKVLISGRLAHVWAEYDFHRGAAFGHCGVDSFSLLKTTDGWKIAGIAYTMQTTGCTPSPLGPPKQ